MPQGVGGVTDFARDFSAGAGIVRAAWDHQERLMQLRGQEAQRALQERQLVAEMQRWDQQNAINQQKIQMAKEQQDKDAADLLTARDYQMFLTEVSGLQTEEAAQASLDLLTSKNPRLALQVAKVHTEKARAKAPEMQNERLLEQQALRNQGMIERQELQNKGKIDQEAYKAQHPKLGAFEQAWQSYQQAIASGDEEQANLFKSRVQKLSGTLPSGALREGEDLASQKQRLEQVQEALKEAPGDRGLLTEQKRLQTVVDSMESRHGIMETQVTTPDGTQVRLTKGSQKTPGELTAAETTRYGEDLQATSNALRSIGRLKGQLGENVVGIGPKLESFVMDEVLGQFDKSLVNKARSAGRQNIRLATQQILGELNNRGRLSNQELEAIKAAMPSLGGAESPQNAQVKLDELSLMLAEKGAAAAQSIKRPVPPEILQTLSGLFPPGAKGEQAMAAEVRNGALSPEVAMQVRKWQKSKGL